MVSEQGECKTLEDRDPQTVQGIVVFHHVLHSVLNAGLCWRNLRHYVYMMVYWIFVSKWSHVSVHIPSKQTAISTSLGHPVFVDYKPIPNTAEWSARLNAYYLVSFPENRFNAYMEADWLEHDGYVTSTLRECIEWCFHRTRPTITCVRAVITLLYYGESWNVYEPSTSTAIFPHKWKIEVDRAAQSASGCDKGSVTFRRVDQLSDLAGPTD